MRLQTQIERVSREAIASGHVLFTPTVLHKLEQSGITVRHTSSRRCRTWNGSLIFGTPWIGRNPHKRPSLPKRWGIHFCRPNLPWWWTLTLRLRIGSCWTSTASVKVIPCWSRSVRSAMELSKEHFVSFIFFLSPSCSFLFLISWAVYRFHKL